MPASSTPPFGRLLTAMVTPFGPDLALDLDAAQRLAAHLVDEQGHDGLVISGTTGESPTTTDAEKRDLLRAVVEAVGDRASVVAGIGTFDTAHTVELADQATEAGADGLLVVTPYYSKPPQAGVLRHFTTVADRASLPIMVYDVPHRTALALATSTLIELAGHERIVAVKDAKTDLAATGTVLAATEAAGTPLAYYCGDDALTLSTLAVGGVGVVGTSTHFTGPHTRALLDAWFAGDPATALAHHRAALPLYTGIFATSGCILVKAGLELLGRPVGGLRSPLVEATPAERDALADALRAVGVLR